MSFCVIMGFCPESFSPQGGRRLINCHFRALGLYLNNDLFLEVLDNFLYLPLANSSGCSDPLFPNPERLRDSGKSLSIRPVEELLRHDLIGKWSIDADTSLFYGRQFGRIGEDHYRMWSRE